MAAPEFTSSLPRPWVLITVEGNGQPGRRRPTSIAWLEYDNGDTYDGGPVFFGRDARWYFQYKHRQRITKDRVVHTFPCARGPGLRPDHRTDPHGESRGTAQPSRGLRAMTNRIRSDFDRRADRHIGIGIGLIVLAAALALLLVSETARMGAVYGAVKAATFVLAVMP